MNKTWQSLDEFMASRLSLDLVNTNLTKTGMVLIVYSVFISSWAESTKGFSSLKPQEDPDSFLFLLLVWEDPDSNM